MDSLTEISLYTGTGAFTLGVRLAGIPVQTICYVENDPYCQKIIKARIDDGYLDDAPIWDDVRTFDGNPWRGLADLLTAGFPCQPHSTAGKRAGGKDSRDLWPETIRLIREIRPARVLLENVPGLLVASRGLPPYAGRVVGELAEAGYDAEWRCISAADVGASQRRKRWWCVAYARFDGGRQQPGDDTSASGENEGERLQRERLRAPADNGGGDVADVRREHQHLQQSPQGVREPSGEGSDMAVANSPRRSAARGRANQYTGPEPKARGDHLEKSEGVRRRPRRAKPAREQGRADATESDSAMAIPGSGDVGDAHDARLEGRRWDSTGAHSFSAWPPGPADSDAWAEVLRHDPSLEPALRRVADGSASRVDGPQANRVQRLRALGNGVVPQVVARFLKEVIGGL